MKKLVCILLLCCLCLPALAENPGVYQPLYQSPAAKRSGETISASLPAEDVALIAAYLPHLAPFSLGVGRTFLYHEQGMLIVEHTAQSAGDHCLISCRTQDQAGQAVLEFLIEQFSANGTKTLGAVYALIGNEWQLSFLP